MKFAYADPPYLGCGAMYSHLHPDALAWNDLESHRRLIERLSDDFPDGWAMSLHSPSLRAILPLCPEDVRVMAWVKPFCAFKANVNPAYSWEPVIVRGGRKRTRWEEKIRDWVSERITMKKNCPGAKPRDFCWWIFDVLNMHPGDEFHDLFPGSGMVGDAWAEWKRQPRLTLTSKRPKRKSLDFFGIDQGTTP